MRNLRFRRATRTSALGAAALIASLSLTACQGDNAGTSDTGASAPAGSSSQAPAENSGASDDKSTATPDTDQGKNAAVPSTGSGSDAGSGSSSGGGTSTAKPQDVNAAADSAVVSACTGANTKLTMTAVQQPVNHMLLTMTNTGSKACNAYYYPHLRFGAAQSVPKTFEDSKPQAVATINPGESVYAGAMTSSADGSGANGYSTKDLSVSFQNRDGNSDGTGSAVKVPLAQSVFVDSSLTVTYWQTSMEDALTY